MSCWTVYIRAVATWAEMDGSCDEVDQDTSKANVEIVQFHVPFFSLLQNFVRCQIDIDPIAEVLSEVRHKIDWLIAHRRID